MKRIMSLDYGTVRIGVAVSDPEWIIAQPLPFIKRSSHDVQDRLVEIIVQYDIGEIVMGLPRHMNGSESAMCGEIRAFGAELSEKSGVPITYWDERLTTVQAERALIEMGTRRKKRKKNIDSLAAVFILRNYLEYRKQDVHDDLW